ncbi:MAG: SDR family oxidoreductase [Erysipelotrichia bacterium]|nr:SDR family oxidoreductase [Erysipelotrichia bacterium]
MKKVCVITGGGSGMGLAAAKFIPKDHIIVVSGRTESKLTKAVEELKADGFEAYSKVCDTSKRESVKELAEYAATLGEITNVIHAAGVSPAMNVTPEILLQINALGTVYVNQEFSKLMHKGSAIVDIASMSAYCLPSFMIPKKAYKFAETDEALFFKKALKMTKMIKDAYQKNGLAYSISKNFVTWYAAKCAFEYGPKGIRVASLSPGLIATDMGNLESAHGGQMLATTCENRMGTPEELGFAIATLADERNGYLAGVDILCDGGTIRGQNEFKKGQK